MKKIIILLVVVVIIFIGYFIFKSPANVDVDNNSNPNIIIDDENLNNDKGVDIQTKDKSQSIIGQSAGNLDLMAYHFGDGGDEILFIGGIHGGYEWNTSLLSFELIEYLKNNKEIIPANEKITVIPVLNPDGLKIVVGSSTNFQKSDVPKEEAKTVVGRFNANNVDLNRNFDCDWQKNATWQDKTVSGGDRAFSEPESLAIKNYIEKQNPKAVIVFYSAAGGVFSSSCHNGVLEETTKLTNLYSKASGYKAYEEFNFYAITGDMVNWLAKKGIPAISVLLTNHTDTEWTKNQAGVKAIIEYYSKP